METKNLWGDIPSVEKIKTPFAILKEQAAILSELTKGLLIGHCVIKKEANKFILTLAIVAPALDNYNCKVLQIYHDISMYPLNLTDIIMSRQYNCSDEQTYIQILGNVLSSDKTKKVIVGLLAQIESNDTKE